MANHAQVQIQKNITEHGNSTVSKVINNNLHRYTSARLCRCKRTLTSYKNIKGDRFND